MSNNFKQSSRQLPGSLLTQASICFVLVMTLVFVSASKAIAQTTSGTILGVVTDASGAVVPGASVTVTNVGTNLLRTIRTDNSGGYQVSDLDAGNYQVLVEAKGFSSFLRSGITLDARATIRVDVKLAVGKVESRVEVTGNAPIIQTETATVREGIQKQNLLSLPLNIRAVDTSPLFSIATIPGVQVDPSFGISISGSHPAQNEVSVDGFSAVDIRYNIPLQESLPSTETVSEVNVTEQLASAEYGQVGDISFITHGGTNEFHGSIFEYLQNDAMDATPLFAISKPPKHANTFGGSIGGPVRFPHFNGKDKTFFYFAWETNLFHTSNAISQGVPTQDMRNGNFSALCGTFNASGLCTDPTGIQLTNPFTGQPYPGNIITNLNSTSQKILNAFYPLPDFGSGISSLDSNYRTIGAAPVDTNLFDVRIDQKVGAKHAIWGRFSWKNDNATIPLGLLQGNLSEQTYPRSVGVNYTYVIKPELLNEFRFGYSQQSNSFIFDNYLNGAQLIQQLGLQLPGPFPPGSAIPGFNFFQSGITSTGNGREEHRLQHRLQFNDNLTWIHGKHLMKFGTDIRRLNLQDFVDFIGADDFGNFNFNGQFTGYDIADFLLGLPSQSNIAITGPPFNASEWAFGFYGQDQFQLTPKLTITYGLRYEVHPPFFDQTLQMTNFDPTNGDVVVPNAASLKLAAPGFLQAINACPGYPGLTTPCTPVVTAAEDHKPEKLRNTDLTKILPRFSLAYRLSDKTVLRAGFGMYDETLTGLTFYSLVGIHTANVQSFSNSVTNGVAAIQFPNTILGGIGSVPPPGSEDFRTATQFNLHDPYAQQWSGTVERELGANTGLRITYTGMRSVGLLINPDLNSVQPSTQPYNPANKPFPDFRIIYQTANGGEAIYNALETVLTHRFSHGLMVQSTYVFAKNLSDAEGSGTGFPNENQIFAEENGPFIADAFNPRYDYGDVSFTPRHRWLTTYRYELPLGKGQKFGGNMPGFLNALIGNWYTSGILLLQTGPHLTPFYFGDPAHDPSGIGLFFKDPGERPDRVCNGNISQPTANQYFDPSCFVLPLTGLGRFGNAAVGILTGPGTVSWNAGLGKIWSIQERYKVRFEATANNLANHPNLGIPDMNVGNTGDFGVIHGIQNVEGAGGRTLQLALRLDF